MKGTLAKKEVGLSEREMDQQSVDNGALEQLQSSTPQFSSAAERRLVRKIDFTFVPSL
jgi:hypothetical protein